MSAKGWIHSVETFGTLDGPGVRYVLFLQGCALRCIYCHNPDTWAVTEQDGSGCPGHAGRGTDSARAVAEILEYRNFIKSGGVTLSGGEPLLQPEFARDILRHCREEGIHTALDTAGSVPLRVSAPVLDESDLVLLDIKSLDDAQCRELTGKGNADTLATLDHCEKTGKPVWIRHVLLPGWTLEQARLKALARYLKSYRCVENIELLPFHKLGEYKWKSLELPYKLGDTPEPTGAEISDAYRIFESEGLPVAASLPHRLHSA